MKKVKFILVALVAMFTTTAMAQATYTDAENNKYEFQKPRTTSMSSRSTGS